MKQAKVLAKQEEISFLVSFISGFTVSVIPSIHSNRLGIAAKLLTNPGKLSPAKKIARSAITFFT